MPDTRNSHKRSSHRGKLVLATLFMLFSAVSITSCTSAPEPLPEAPTSIDGLSMTPDLREDRGEVVLPIDRFTPSFLETDLLAKATAFRLAECLAQRGVDFDPRGPLTDSVYSSEQYYGPWTPEQAQQFGFVPPMSPADLVANGIESAPALDEPSSTTESSTLSETAQGLADECAQTPAVLAFITPQIVEGAWTAQIDEAHTRVFDIDDARGALNDLHECFESHDVTTDTSDPWLPENADGRSLAADQRELAQTVVSCKAETNFTLRVATVEAALQANIIDEYADELFDYRNQLEHALAEARTLFEAEDIPFIA